MNLALPSPLHSAAPGAALRAGRRVGLRAAVLAACAAACAAHAGDAPPPEARMQQIVQEDDHVRVEELRVRGQTEQVTVQPKSAGRPYQIITSSQGRDLGSTAEGRRGAVGQRVWSVLGF